MKINPLHPKFGAEIRGLDLAQPLHHETSNELRAALLNSKVLIFRGQLVSPEKYIQFCSAIGKIWTTEDEMKLEKHFQYETHKELVRVSNKFGVLGKIELLYHADGSHHPSKPYPIRCLYAQSIPKGCGGATTWADMEIAYETLSKGIKDRIENLRARHVPRYSTGWENEVVLHPLVRVHPVSGRKSLSVDQYFTRFIEGLSEKDSSELLTDLIEHSISQGNLYTHEWKPGDLVIFDNNNTVHRRDVITSKDERLLLRITMDYDYVNSSTLS
ncbi:MAG: TauD/TfdA dioxygenase family protein [Pseudobdellovibrionaceae bacterium]